MKELGAIGKFNNGQLEYIGSWLTKLLNMQQFDYSFQTICLAKNQPTPRVYFGKRTGDTTAVYCIRDELIFLYRSSREFDFEFLSFLVC